MGIKDFLKKHYLEILILIVILLALYGGFFIIQNAEPDRFKEVLPLLPLSFLKSFYGNGE